MNIGFFDCRLGSVEREHSFFDRTSGVFCDKSHKHMCHKCVCHEPDESSHDPEESSQGHEGGLFLIRGWVILMGDGAPVGETGGISL